MNLRRLNIVLHRDIGYFFSGLIIIYCISGLALNHIDDWNPDFVIHKSAVEIPKSYPKEEITEERIAEFNAIVGEADYKVLDFPTSTHVKIYYDNATLLIDLASKTGMYEKVERRPLVYESNVLHRNSIKGWKWASDLFAVMLIFISISGWFMLKGKNGIIGRGKWFIAAGMVPPVLAIVLFNLLQK
ncbi:MAG: PepSY-associated TM helix domain-containing protein [Bacteroidota bacterium]